MVKRIFALMLALCLAMLPCAANALSTADATEKLSLTQDCSVTAVYGSDGEVFSAAQVKLYKIADITDELQYVYTDDFAPCDISINGIQSNSEWNVRRTTFESHIAANGITPYAVDVTDDNGAISFPGLRPGLYMLSAVTAEKNGMRYYFDTALVALPGIDADTRKWSYDVQLTPKPDIDIDDNGDVHYQVVKLWKGDSSGSRPKSITIDILRNGVVMKTVELSNEHGWSYTWSAENDGAEWTVAEKNVPSGYKALVEKHSTTFVVTNSIKSTDVPKTGDTANIALYIVLLCGAGIALVLIGVAARRRSK